MHELHKWEKIWAQTFDFGIAGLTEWPEMKTVTIIDVNCVPTNSFMPA